MYDYEEEIGNIDERELSNYNINNLESSGVRLATLAIKNDLLDEDEILQIFDWLKSHSFDFSYDDRVNSPLKKAIEKNYINTISWLFEHGELPRDRHFIEELIGYTRAIHRRDRQIADQIINKLLSYLGEEIVE